MFSLIIASVIHLILVHLFVKVFNWGFFGICIATSIMFVNRFIACVVQIEFTPSLKNVYGVKLFSQEST